jgi:hypothetical protein
MIINKKWHANSASWIAWVSPVEGGPDILGAHYTLVYPTFASLTGDVVVVDSDFEGADVGDEVQFILNPSSLWTVNISDPTSLVQSGFLEGHTGLWGVCLDESFDLIPSSVNMVDILWELDTNGNVMPRALSQNISQG